jgi:hypothetical protein
MTGNVGELPSSERKGLGEDMPGHPRPVSGSLGLRGLVHMHHGRGDDDGHCDELWRIVKDRLFTDDRQCRHRAWQRNNLHLSESGREFHGDARQLGNDGSNLRLQDLQLMDDIALLLIQPKLMGDILPHVAPFLRAGLATDGLDLMDFADGLASGDVQLWVATEGSKIYGALLTAIVTENDRKLLDIGGLGGAGVLRWGKVASRTLKAFAKEHDCEAMIFAGHKGSLRAYEGFRIVGEHRPGHYQFEGAVQ